MIDIKIENLEVSYPLAKNEKVKALQGFSALFPSGSFCLLSGPSGAGKSTLLKTLAGLLPYEGRITWGEQDFAALGFKQLQLAYVSQDLLLYPHKDVFSNLAFPLLAAKVKKEEARVRVYALAESLGIAHCLARPIEELSLGQQELVALGKSLIKNPDVILLDEPFAGLDLPGRNAAGSFLKQWGLEHKATILYVGHSPEEAFRLADRFYLLEGGKLAFQGNGEELRRSRLPAALDFCSLCVGLKP